MIDDRFGLLSCFNGGHILANAFIQRGLVPLYCQKIIRILFPNGSRNLLLTSHRIYAYDAFAHVQQLHQFWDRSYLVRLLVRLDLPQA